MALVLTKHSVLTLNDIKHPDFKEAVICASNKNNFGLIKEDLIRMMERLYLRFDSSDILNIVKYLHENIFVDIRDYRKHDHLLTKLIFYSGNYETLVYLHENIGLGVNDFRQLKLYIFHMINRNYCFDCVKYLIENIGFTKKDLENNQQITSECQSFLNMNAKHLFGNRELLEYLRDTLSFELKDFKKYGLCKNLIDINRSFAELYYHNKECTIYEFIDMMSSL